MINSPPPSSAPKCREYAATQVDGQRKDFIRLGVLGDWSHPYLTMDFKTEANIIRALGKIIGNGHLHKGAKPVHWCVDGCLRWRKRKLSITTKLLRPSTLLSRQSIRMH
ncbi:class I tRNA ligase family protein [Escherichia coli]